MACVLCDNYLLAGPCPWCEATKGGGDPAALRAENDRLRGRVAELEAALKPFAGYAERWAAGWPDATEVHAPSASPGPVITLGDCRRAAELLAPAADDPGDGERPQHREATMRTGRKVYVAGPYTKPDPCVNTHNAIRAAEELWDAGFVPFVPHLTHLWHTVSPRPYEDWLAYDLHWLQGCDALLRLPGESSGADKEVAYARTRGIRVVHSIAELTDPGDLWRELGGESGEGG